MGKKTAMVGISCAFFCIIYFAIYRGFIYQLFGTTGDETFIAFCALALFLGQNGDFKKLANTAGSGACGAIWGFIFMWGVGILMPICGFNFVVAATIDIFVFTALAIIVHMHFLAKTVINNMPFVFVGVATTFSLRAAEGFLGVVQIALLILCGCLIGGATAAAGAKIYGPPPTE